mmetsp:Transcript_31368/g.106328  ORF Transcript_31368/g.106328 Transcript_31368/m.106328 type:complete len:209 (+) Transcript_31368:307-933(+)
MSSGATRWTALAMPLAATLSAKATMRAWSFACDASADSGPVPPKPTSAMSASSCAECSANSVRTAASASRDRSLASASRSAVSSACSSSISAWPTLGSGRTPPAVFRRFGSSSSPASSKSSGASPTSATFSTRSATVRPARPPTVTATRPLRFRSTGVCATIPCAPSSSGALAKPRSTTSAPTGNASSSGASSSGAIICSTARNARSR